jgi:hypothetical protein
MLGSLTLMMHLIPQNLEERGTRVIITDSSGTMIRAQAGWYDHLEDALQAEAPAIHDGLMMAREAGATKLMVESDCVHGEIIEHGRWLPIYTVEYLCLRTNRIGSWKLLLETRKPNYPVSSIKAGTTGVNEEVLPLTKSCLDGGEERTTINTMGCAGGYKI